jgi:hypothetical protein
MHDSASCRHCESLPAARHRRHWKHQPKAGPWHVIADDPDLLRRLPGQAHFFTILSYCLDPEGNPAHYRGPLYWEFDAADPVQALNDLRRCVHILQVDYDCWPEALHVWHSGGRGFHITIPAMVIGADAGHPLLPRIYGAMIQELFPPQVAPTLDRGVYNMGKGRMWRLPNRRRLDTGRYKVALAMREVLHRTPAELESWTRRPRAGVFWPPEDDLSPCPGLVQLYQDTVAVERLRRPRPPTRGVPAGGSGDVARVLGRCAFLQHCRDDAVTLSEPEWYAMVSNVARCRDGRAVVHEFSAPYPHYSPQETDAKIGHALQHTGPHTCRFIQGLGFPGCPPEGCGVKAPIGLSEPTQPRGVLHA